jgi:hypothetical protein
MTGQSALPPYFMFYGGAERVAPSGTTFDGVVPTVAHPWPTLADGDTRDVDVAVDADVAALSRPAWGGFLYPSWTLADAVR